MRKTSRSITLAAVLIALLTGCNSNIIKTTESRLKRNWFSEVEIREDELFVVFLTDGVFNINSVELGKATLPAFDDFMAVCAHQGYSDVFTVDAHTDNKALPEDALRQTKRRARRIERYLKRQLPDVDSELTAAGHGSTMPRADNTTMQGRMLNRRVELSCSDRSFFD